MAAIPSSCARHIPEMDGALYFGHPGNRGDAVLWGEALGARLAHLSGYQGHGSVAHPHGILITWATIMEGGFQVDAAGRALLRRDAAAIPNRPRTSSRRPAGVALTIFDERIAAIARQFEDFRQAEAAGAMVVGRHASRSSPRG